MAKYDVVVIGGGHNGLTTAAYLGKSGRSVLVLEKRSGLGGLASGRDFHPGFRSNGLLHDTSCVRQKVIDDLKLKEHGLIISNRRPATALLRRGADGCVVSGDVDQTSEQIARFSDKDAHAYRRYSEFIDTIRPLVRSVLDSVPPNLNELNGGTIWQLLRTGTKLRRLGKDTMHELLKVAPMSVADFLNQYFETGFLKAGLAWPAVLGSYTGPWSSYTTLNLLMWEATSGVSISGGPERLVAALASAVRASGVEIRTGVAVEKILVDPNSGVRGVVLSGGEEVETKAVSASCHPCHAFFDLMVPAEIGGLELTLRHYRSRGTTAKVTLAVRGDVSFPVKTDGALSLARTTASLDDLEKAFDAVKYREMSADPVLDISVPSLEDPSLAPDGHHVVSILVHYMPYDLKSGWTEDARKAVGDLVERTLITYLPGLSDAVVGREVLTPAELETDYGLPNGQIFHGEHAVDQLLTRPLPSCPQYRTPFAGLFLSGSGTHPGGGLTCMPGALSAKTVLRAT